MNREYMLHGSDLSCIDEIIRSIHSVGADDTELHVKAGTAAQSLPVRLREYLAAFRAEAGNPFCLVSGFPVDDAAIGPTPAKTLSVVVGPATREEIFLALVANVLGTPFSFASQQQGHLVQNVLPTRGNEYSQLGAGSKEELVWHTEDAFHPNRPDFILLMCLRNDQRVGTTVGALPAGITRDDIDALFEDDFYFKPDPDHASHLKNWRTDEERRAYERMQRFVESPERRSVLYGSRSSPYMRLDPVFTEVASPDAPSADAYQRLLQTMDKQLVDVALVPGEILIVDNHRAVHGRRKFTPRYDGRDRWLKKINVTLDAKKSSDARFYQRQFVVA